jgi:thiamine-monophosphate kinase
MIDISDGLLQDLGHICQASKVGAVIWNDNLPISSAYRALLGKVGSGYALSGGEDYELLFCARPRHRQLIDKLHRAGRVKITRIGRCVGAKQGIVVLDDSGKPIKSKIPGHDHFKKQ